MSLFEKPREGLTDQGGGNSPPIPFTPNPQRRSLAEPNGLPRYFGVVSRGQYDIALDYVYANFPGRERETRIEQQAAAASVLRGPE